MRLRGSAGALSRALRLLLVAGLLLALAGIGAAIGVYIVFLRDLPDLQTVDDYKPALASRVVDRKGQTIGQFFSERRRLTPLDHVPPHVVDAFVAGEDNSFFEHEGVDFGADILEILFGGVPVPDQPGRIGVERITRGVRVSFFRRPVEHLVIGQRV